RCRGRPTASSCARSGILSPPPMSHCSTIRCNGRPMKLGVRLESLALPFRRALDAAQRLDAGGVQIDAVGDLAPDALSQTGRRELRHLLRARGLEFCAVGCPLRHGLDVAENQESRIDHLKKVMSLSFDL